MKIGVVCPSRDRAGAAARTYQSMLDTSSDTTMILVVDDDQASDYAHMDAPRLIVSVQPRTTMVREINTAIRQNPDFDAYGLIVDDAWFRTPGWDKWVSAAFDAMPKRLGVVSAFHPHGPWVNFPYVSREWIDLVGWFACPDTAYFCWDGVLEALGEATCIRYATKEEFWIDHEALQDRDDRIQRLILDGTHFLGWFMHERRKLVIKIREAIAR